MKKWYKESYFDSNSWIMENYDKLGLNSDETLLILLIDFYKKNHKPITYDLLSTKFNKDLKYIDSLISSLVEKHYLKVYINGDDLVFDIDSIFEFDVEQYEISENEDIYNLMDEIFGKPLSMSELQKMNDLLDKYGQNRFLEAVRIAEGNKKLKMPYIEGILRNEK